MHFNLQTGIILIIFFYTFGTVLFFNGFLPKSHQIDKKIVLPSNQANEEDSRVIDRVVLVLIDALREDFVFDDIAATLKNKARKKNKKRMPFLQRLIEQNKTFSYVSKASLPTVTMPRIKAIVSGSIPSFYEIIENSISREYSQDNFIHQLQNKNMSMVFYGDNTWLKLFPNSFLRSEGTNSFYVNDFHEVDDNVTRHLTSELQSTDWDMLSLHYLGLDHIGHAKGPYSSFVAPKLNEMDKIIKQIYETLKIQNKRTMIIVTGDHGMSNAGSHGGSSKEETNTPLIFIPTFSNGIASSKTIVKQTDIAITISLLLGTEIPANSIGKPIPFYQQYYNEDKLLFFKRRLSCHFDLMIPSDVTFKDLLNDLCKGLHNDEEVIDRASNYLVQNSSKYNEVLMIFGIVAVFGTTIAATIFYFKYSSQFNNIQELLPAVTKIYVFGWLLVLQLSQLSSSLIEEEHYLYYYGLPSFIVLITVVQKGHRTFSTIMLLLMLRISREWNRIGVKWSDLEDIENLLSSNQKGLLLSIVLGFFLVLWIKKKNFKDPLALASFILITIYKLCACNDVFPWLVCNQKLQINLGKLIYFILLINISLHKLQGEVVKTSWFLLTFLLLRPTNYLWFCFLAVSEKILIQKIVHFVIGNGTSEQLFFVYWTVSRFFHFSQGNSNSFATVDIAAGMIGFAEYHEILSVVISFLATYSSLIYWTVAFFISLSNFHPSILKSVGFNILIYQLFEAFLYTIVVFLMRYHLFIWSVFAPKYFFMLAQSFINLFFIVPLFIFT